MEIKNLTKLFNDKVIFENYSICIPENKITFIMGESGCGKTTLLKMICGLDKEYDGEILLSSNKLSCVFQEPRLFPTLTAKENIELVEKGGEFSSDDVLKLVELDRGHHRWVYHFTCSCVFG